MPTIEQARYWYSDKDPVHNFEHVLRVYRLAERICQAEGADLEIIRAAVLLHDIQLSEGQIDRSAFDRPNEDLVDSSSQARRQHHQAAASFARQVLATEGWPEERIAAVEHAVQAHRFRDNRQQPQTLEAKILFDADKLDAIGAIGVARAVAYAVLAQQPIFAQPSEQFLNTGRTQEGEAHSAYHEYLFKLRKLKERLFTPAAKRIAQERHDFMVAYFERLQDEIKGLR